MIRNKDERGPFLLKLIDDAKAFVMDGRNAHSLQRIDRARQTAHEIIWAWECERAEVDILGEELISARNIIQSYKDERQKFLERIRLLEIRVRYWEHAARAPYDRATLDSIEAELLAASHA